MGRIPSACDFPRYAQSFLMCRHLGFRIGEIGLRVILEPMEVGSRSFCLASLEMELDFRSNLFARMRSLRSAQQRNHKAALGATTYGATRLLSRRAPRLVWRIVPGDVRLQLLRRPFDAYTANACPGSLLWVGSSHALHAVHNTHHVPRELPTPASGASA